jgi:hypothetical protein
VLFFNKLTLKIHCWGGLGSQLLALNYYLRVQEKFPTKRIILVLHTGGITSRSSEIDFLNNKINLLKVDDYQSSSSKILVKNRSSLSIFTSAKIYTKFLANFLKFIITDDKKVLQVRSWTISVRCTYTSNILRKDDIVHMANILGINTKSLEQNFLGIHYRMGDLPTLKPESLVPLNSISAVISSLINTGLIVDKVKVFSDTIMSDSNLKLPDKINCEWKSVDTLQTIRDLSQAKYFIGTSSKVSLWVAIFRWALDAPGDIYLPNSIIGQFVELANVDQNDSAAVMIKTYS